MQADTSPPDRRPTERRRPGNITDAIHRWQHGEADVDDAAYAIVHEELRRVAIAACRGRNPTGVTPTDLVHDLWLRLQRQDGGPKWPSRRHFYAAAATAMRRLLIDERRRRQTRKRRAVGERIELEHLAAVYDEAQVDVLATNEALARLAQRAPLCAEVAELRIFLWLTHEEIGAALGLTRRQVDRHWALARQSLSRTLGGD
ncbi:MAG: sigma-70 family RNA polymerase sigma factor [Planctomycetes bacterium]|nr:sigma-70 family RNA polymerase sigma factor [Planctomycetota bacterium]